MTDCTIQYSLIILLHELVFSVAKVHDILCVPDSSSYIPDSSLKPK